MQRVTVRTLTLMVVLLLAVIALQCLPAAQPVKASAVWLAGNGSGPLATPCEANECAMET